MKTLRDSGLLFLRPFLQNMRNPSFVIVNITTPLMYLVLFMPLLKKLHGPGFDSGHVLQVFLPGIIALLFVAAGTGSVFPNVIFELKKGLIERLRVTPTSRFALLFGPILSWVAWTLMSSAVIVAVSVPFGFRVHAAGLAVFAVLLVLLLTVFAAFVTALAVLMNGEITSISGIVVGLNLPIVLLGGVLLPLALAPGWLQALGPHRSPVLRSGGRTGPGRRRRRYQRRRRGVRRAHSAGGPHPLVGVAGVSQGGGVGKRRAGNTGVTMGARREGEVIGHATGLGRSHQDLAKRLTRGPVAMVEPQDPAAQRAWREILEILFSPGDAALAARLPVVPTTVEDLARRTGMDAAGLLARDWTRWPARGSSSTCTTRGAARRRTCSRRPSWASSSPP